MFVLLLLFGWLFFVHLCLFVLFLLFLLFLCLLVFFVVVVIDVFCLFVCSCSCCFFSVTAYKLMSYSCE